MFLVVSSIHNHIITIVVPIFQSIPVIFLISMILWLLVEFPVTWFLGIVSPVEIIQPYNLFFPSLSYMCHTQISVVPIKYIFVSS